LGVILDYQRPGIPDYTKPSPSDDDNERPSRWLLVPGFLGVLLFLHYHSDALVGRTPCTKTDAAKTDIMMLGSALDLYRDDVGQYPTDADGLNALHVAPPRATGWRGPYVRRHVPNDPWGNPYVYHATTPSGIDPYTILSRGPDGTEGTSDDVVNK
jgi:general secretion pathway protein G